MIKIEFLRSVIDVLLESGQVIIKKNGGLMFKLVLFSVAAAFAIDKNELPFKKYYGDYKITACKRLDKKDQGIDLCGFEAISISQAPANYGAPSTHFNFKGGKGKPEYMSFSPPREVKNVKYEVSDAGDHFNSDIVSDNTKLHCVTDAILSKNQDGSLNVKIEDTDLGCAIGGSGDSRSLNHELTLK